MNDLVASLLQGDRRALARLLTYVENEREGVQTALAALFSHTGRAWVVGVTGAPGTGKSTLVGELAKAYRARGSTVGILAVDPTSPFSGGALLGDRIRMRDLSGDDGVFIRSMATRGSPGGLARAARDAVRVMDAAGLDIIFIETVGAGQNEVEIARAAYTTVVVEAPGLGDEVQAIKAGILEIADILVVNKADLPGADLTERALRMMLEMGHPGTHSRFAGHHGRLLSASNGDANGRDGPLWMPPVIQTVAAEGAGVDALVEALDQHRRLLAAGGLLAKLERQHLEAELEERLRDALVERLRQTVPDARFADLIERIQARELTPQAAVTQLLAEAHLFK